MEEKKVVIEEKDINRNIKFFLNLAYGVRICGLIIFGIAFALGCVSFIKEVVSIVSNNGADFGNTLNFFIISGVYALLGFTGSAILKWHAYMLYTNKNKK